jgi:hypothetical protein
MIDGLVFLTNVIIIEPVKILEGLIVKGWQLVRSRWGFQIKTIAEIQSISEVF